MLTFVSIGSGFGIIPWERKQKRQSECYTAKWGASTSSCTHTDVHTNIQDEVTNWLIGLLFSAEGPRNPQRGSHKRLASAQKIEIPKNHQIWKLSLLVLLWQRKSPCGMQLMLFCHHMHCWIPAEWVYLFNKCHQRLEVFCWLAGTREGSAPLGKFMQKVTHKSRQPYNLDSIKIAPVFALRFLFFLNRFPLSTLTKSRASIGERRMCNCFHRRAFTHSHAHTVWSPPEIWMNPADWRGKKTLRWLQ